MIEYKIRLVKKHLLFNCDGLTYMVDTGCPFTFTREGRSVILGGKEYVCERPGQFPNMPNLPKLPGMPSFEEFMKMMAPQMPQMQGMPQMPGMPDPIEYLDNASKFVGEKIDVMLGIDVLQNFRVVIDYRNHSLKLYEAAENPVFQVDDQRALQVSTDGHIGMEATVNGHAVRLAIDTGACIQYIAKEISSGVNPSGEAEDYHETTGHFRTPLYTLQVLMGAESSYEDFGNLPDQLMQGLTMSNFQGVVGFDFFNDHKVILDFVEGKISWTLY